MSVTTPAASYSSYPTDEDISGLITGAGITVPSGLVVANFRLAAIEEWEQGTGYVPYLAGASATYKFDPPGPNTRGMNRGGGRKLLLTQAFATITEVRVGVTIDNVGEALTENSDFFLGPTNHAALKIPITEIFFAGWRWGIPNSVTVTGTPGFFTTIRANVWNAIRALAAGRMAQAIRESTAVSDPVEWKDGDISERRSIELLGKLGDGWMSEARAAMKQNRFIH